MFGSQNKLYEAQYRFLKTEQDWELWKRKTKENFSKVMVHKLTLPKYPFPLEQFAGIGVQEMLRLSWGSAFPGDEVQGWEPKYLVQPGFQLFFCRCKSHAAHCISASSRAIIFSNSGSFSANFVLFFPCRHPEPNFWKRMVFGASQGEVISLLAAQLPEHWWESWD